MSDENKDQTIDTVENQTGKQEEKTQPEQETTTEETPKQETNDTEIKTEESKSPETKSEEQKEPVTFSLSWDKQKALKDLTLYDLIMWRNIYATFVVFLSGHALYTLITRYQFSFITLFARILFFQVLIFFIYSVAKQLWTSSTNVEFSFSKFELTKEMIQPWVDSAIEKINRIIAFYISILEVKDVASTLKVLVALQVICMLGNWIRGLTLLYTVFLIGFTAPKIYEVYQKPIDKYAGISKQKVQELLHKGYEAIPKSVKDQINTFSQKLKVKTQ